jgi:hypothetical protein
MNLFSLRRNGGKLAGLPVTLITNGEPIGDQDREFFERNFAPIDFRVSPRLGAIPHTSKLNVFYSIDPSSYDVLIFMDCDTVICKPLDNMLDAIERGEADFVCRRGGETDRDSFTNFDALVAKFCGPGPLQKVHFEGADEWPMFNSGVFIATADAVRSVRKDSINITYQIYDRWLSGEGIRRLPTSVKDQLAGLNQDYSIQQEVTRYWAIEQGSLALACIKAGINVRYLDEKYNNWGGDEELCILHCFKSVYQFDRRTMYSDESEAWIHDYSASDIPGKRFLARLVDEFKDALVA